MSKSYTFKVNLFAGGKFFWLLPVYIKVSIEVSDTDERQIRFYRDSVALIIGW